MPYHYCQKVTVLNWFSLSVCLLSWLPVLIMLMSSPHKYIVNRPKKHISCKTNFLCLPSAVITRLWLRWVATLYKLSVNLHETLIILCYNPITGSLHIVPLSWIGCQHFPIPSSVFTFFSIIKSVTSPMLIWSEVVSFCQSCNGSSTSVWYNWKNDITMKDTIRYNIPNLWVQIRVLRYRFALACL